MRRDFALPMADQGFLEGRGKPWEAVAVNRERWVLLEEFTLPSGFNVPSASVALLLPSAYPDVQIDMAYFHPFLARSDRKAINALTPRMIDGRQWQQWSRHRKPEDWRPGIDNIETHLWYVTAWLEQELRR